MPPDTVRALLEEARTRLEKAGCDTPGLDARLLLQRAGSLSREDIILDPARQLSADALTAFAGLIARRTAREPVSRILGEREFYGRVFQVTTAVLDPRADTETLIDAALGAMRPDARILDLGTGSGAIIVTLLAECPGAAGVATDISAEALAVARANAERLGVADRLQFLSGDWFDPVAGTFDLIVSNPPYIPRGAIAALSADVRDFDPHIALAGGEDGLDPYRAIARGASAHLAADGAILVEIGAGQEGDVAEIFEASGLRFASRHRDLGSHDRCLVFSQP